VPDDEPRLVKRIVWLACEYGRYGYRRITVLLHWEGWRVNHKRVERIWRAEGLKVPKKLPHAREAVRIERNADNLNNLGILIAESDPEEAEACFREAIAMDGRLAAARLNLGKLLAMTGRRAEAAELLGRPTDLPLSHVPPLEEQHGQ